MGFGLPIKEEVDGNDKTFLCDNVECVGATAAIRHFFGIRIETTTSKSCYSRVPRHLPPPAPSEAFEMNRL